MVNTGHKQLTISPSSSTPGSEQERAYTKIMYTLVQADWGGTVSVSDLLKQVAEAHPLSFSPIQALLERVVEVYPLSFSRAQDLLDRVRQQEIERAGELLARRAASFDDLDRILIEQREGIVDLLFVVTGDLYSDETVVLDWIHDLREDLTHVELDFVIVPFSALSAAEWSQGAKVLYERGTRSP